MQKSKYISRDMPEGTFSIYGSQVASEGNNVQWQDCTIWYMLAWKITSNCELDEKKTASHKSNGWWLWSGMWDKVGKMKKRANVFIYKELNNHNKSRRHISINLYLCQCCSHCICAFHINRTLSSVKTTFLLRGPKMTTTRIGESLHAKNSPTDWYRKWFTWEESIQKNQDHKES